VIDAFADELLTFKQAVALIPGRPHFFTIHRWAREGVRGHRLETVRIAGQRYTTREALNRFFQATADTTAGNSQPAPRKLRRAAK
jgi:hypothetical protein